MKISTDGSYSVVKFVGKRVYYEDKETGGIPKDKLILYKFSKKFDNPIIAKMQISKTGRLYTNDIVDVLLKDVIACLFNEVSNSEYAKQLGMLKNLSYKLSLFDDKLSNYLNHCYLTSVFDSLDSLNMYYSSIADEIKSFSLVCRYMQYFTDSQREIKDGLTEFIKWFSVNPIELGLDIHSSNCGFTKSGRFIIFDPFYLG